MPGPADFRLGLRPSAIQAVSGLIAAVGTEIKVIGIAQSILTAACGTAEDVVVVVRPIGASTACRVGSKTLSPRLAEPLLPTCWEANVTGAKPRRFVADPGNLVALDCKSCLSCTDRQVVLALRQCHAGLLLNALELLIPILPPSVSQCVVRSSRTSGAAESRGLRLPERSAAGIQTLGHAVGPAWHSALTPWNPV